MTQTIIGITAQVTPNPNSLKFVVDRRILPSGSIDFAEPTKGETSPLVQALFQIKGMEQVLIGTNFVTVTKSVSVDWTDIAEKVTTVIKEKLGSEEAPIDPQLLENGDNIKDATEIERKIIEILDTEIRPAVAMDGGDIIFDRFEDGVLYLQLQGACSSCPSSVMTLKMGIENRLKEDIPELKEVVQS